MGYFLCQNCYEKLEFYVLPISLSVLPIEDIQLDSLIAAVRYDRIIGSLLHYLKYKHAEDIAEYCADFLFFSTYFPDTDYISAVPIHSSRQSERGFNQAELIAKSLSTLMKIPYRQFLKKNKKTRSQASLQNQHDRIHNLDAAFMLVENSGKKDSLKNRSILLIDDVCTTGSTLNSCAKILKREGAEQVIGLTIAHGF